MRHLFGRAWLDEQPESSTLDYYGYENEGIDSFIIPYGYDTTFKDESRAKPATATVEAINELLTN